MMALEKASAELQADGPVYDDPINVAATPNNMKDLARLKPADQKLWRGALKQELGGMRTNEALVEVEFHDIPRGKRAMSCLTLFTKKAPDEEGRVRCKVRVRVVVRGCEQAREEGERRPLDRTHDRYGTAQDGRHQGCV